MAEVQAYPMRMLLACCDLLLVSRLICSLGCFLSQRCTPHVGGLLHAAPTGQSGWQWGHYQ